MNCQLYGCLVCKFRDALFGFSFNFTIKMITAQIFTYKNYNSNNIFLIYKYKHETNLLLINKY